MVVGGSVRLVGLDFRAVCAPELLVQHAEEERVLGVHVRGGSLVLRHAVGVGRRQVPEVQQRAAGHRLRIQRVSEALQQLRRTGLLSQRTSMSSSSMESRSLEQPRRACRRESNTRMSAALLRPTMGTKEVDSWSTPSTRLAKLTTEGEDIAESGREGWIGASAARADERRFDAAHKAIEGEEEGGEGDDEYHTS